MILPVRPARPFVLFLALFLAWLPAAVHGEESAGPEVAAGIKKAEDGYWNRLDAAKAAYRKDLSEIVVKGTEVELFLLESAPPEPDEDAEKGVAGWESKVTGDRFPIVPDKSTVKIVAFKKLTEAETQELMPPLKETIGVQKDTGGTLCHFPIHGIRVKSGGKLLFQTSICYKCSNFYVCYPHGGGADWVGLSSRKFEEVMKRLMPLPREEK